MKLSLRFNSKLIIVTSMPSTIYLIRHGETDSNRLSIIQGHLDTELNATGHSQAQSLCERLKSKTIHRLLSSDLKRTQQTAKPLSDCLNLEVELRSSWRELYLGNWEGLNFQQVDEKCPGQQQRYREEWFTFKEHGGESWKELQERALKAFETLVEEIGENQNVAVFSHGGVIRMLLAALLEIPEGKPKFTVDNTGICEIQIKPDANLMGHYPYLVKSLNDRAHLS